MLDFLLYPLQRAASRAARKAVFGTVAGLLILAGCAFLTLAGWIYLAATLGVLYAALVLGLGFIGVGLIVLAAGMRTPRRYRHRPPAAPDSVTLINAFLSGLAAGQGLRRK